MNHAPGAICGRPMNGGADHCGMPRLHRTRCQPEQMPATCEAGRCGKPMPCETHEGCYRLGFDRHQDIVTVTTRDSEGVETTTRCRRCGARFVTAYMPHEMLASR